MHIVYMGREFVCVCVCVCVCTYVLVIDGPILTPFKTTAAKSVCCIVSCSSLPDLSISSYYIYIDICIYIYRYIDI